MPVSQSLCHRSRYRSKVNSKRRNALPSTRRSLRFVLCPLIRFSSSHYQRALTLSVSTLISSCLMILMGHKLLNSYERSNRCIGLWAHALRLRRNLFWKDLYRKKIPQRARYFDGNEASPRLRSFMGGGPILYATLWLTVTRLQLLDRESTPLNTDE